MQKQYENADTRSESVRISDYDRFSIPITYDLFNEASLVAFLESENEWFKGIPYISKNPNQFTAMTLVSKNL